jgi:hypothetical protein
MGLAIRKAVRSSGGVVCSAWRKFVIGASFECILRTRVRRPNGGAVILARSLFITLLIYSVALTVTNVVDPKRAWQFSAGELRTEIVNTLTWFGTIFAAVYFGLYTRFASQWTYLANVYNQIKAAEVKAASGQMTTMAWEKLAEWKAGFIEDAENLHLATKSTFAATVLAWGTEPDVIDKYRDTVSGGKKRLRRLIAVVRNFVKHPARKKSDEKPTRESLARSRRRKPPYRRRPATKGRFEVPSLTKGKP